jgi:hypothetical protein
MPYALFENDEKLSRSFPTRDEAWKQADRAGLVTDDNGKPTLHDNYAIKPCQADPTDDDDGDDWELPGR